MKQHRQYQAGRVKIYESWSKCGKLLHLSYFLESTDKCKNCFPWIKK